MLSIFINITSNSFSAVYKHMQHHGNNVFKNLSSFPYGGSLLILFTLRHLLALPWENYWYRRYPAVPAGWCIDRSCRKQRHSRQSNPLRHRRQTQRDIEWFYIDDIIIMFLSSCSLNHETLATWHKTVVRVDVSFLYKHDKLTKLPEEELYFFIKIIRTTLGNSQGCCKSINVCKAIIR